MHFPFCNPQDAVMQSRFAANDGKLSYSEFAEVMRRLSS